MNLPPPDLPPPTLPEKRNEPTLAQPSSVTVSTLPVAFTARPTEAEVDEPTLNVLSQSWWGISSEALAYPIRGGNRGGLVLAALVVFVIKIASFAPIFGLVTSIGGLSYLASYYFEIIHHTIRGKTDVPAWPDFSDYWDDLVIPGVQMAGITLFSYLPLFLGYWFTSDNEPSQQLLSLGAGYVYVAIFFPMATLAVVCTGSVGSALPHHVLPAILRCLPGYWLCAVLFGVAEFGRGGLASLFSDVPVLGFFLPWMLAVYAMFVQARLTGLIYLRYSERLPW